MTEGTRASVDANRRPNTRIRAAIDEMRESGRCAICGGDNATEHTTLTLGGVDYDRAVICWGCHRG